MKLVRLAVMLMLAAAFAAAFSACKSLPTLQEQFNTFCPIVTGDLVTLSTSPLIPAADQQKLADAASANKAFCTAGGELNVTNLKAFHDSLLPGAITIVQAIPAIPNQTAILLALNTFGPLVQQMIDQIIVTVTPAAASAPTAASAPLSSTGPIQ